MPARGQTQDILKRFESKINKDGAGGCWLWTSASTGRYGIFWVGSTPDIYYGKRNALAHRLAFELYKGPIPKDMMVCHRCNITLCVNPDHLYVGTRKQNSEDAAKAGLYRTKLTKQQVKEMRLLRKQGWYYTDLARRYNISKATARHIAKPDPIKWVHVK